MTTVRPERFPPLVKVQLPKHMGQVPGVYWVATQGFVDELASRLRGKRVLEVFAGNGFLAAHLAQAGVDIRATTIFSGHDAHERGIYFDVEEMRAEHAVLRYGPESDVLLMAWPTTTPAALHAALLWGPEKPLVFIGEMTDLAEGFLGGCATDEFFEFLQVEHRFASYRQGHAHEHAVVARLQLPSPSRKGDSDQPSAESRTSRT